MSVSGKWKQVRPLMSKDMSEARRRVLGLYRAFYRYIPYIVKYFDIPKTEEDCRQKLREKFYYNACIKDIRVVDLLVIKFSPDEDVPDEPRPVVKPFIIGYMELAEIKYNWQQKGHINANWNPSIEPQPQDFVGKFLKGLD